MLGRHPVSNVSYVSGVGAQSKLIAYGNNRADYAFIPGGIIPGVVIIQPDFPELNEGWPFLWYENEYVVDTVTSYIMAAKVRNSPINWSEAAEHPPSRGCCGSRERRRESAFDASRRQTVDNPDRLTR